MPGFIACEQNLKQNLFISYFFACRQATEYHKDLKNHSAMDVNQITKTIIGCGIEVHKQPGPGLPESTFEACLYYESINAGLQVRRQVALPLLFKEIHPEQGYRLDLLIENSVAGDIKMVEAINNIHTAQTLTYLKLSGAKIGLLLNFNVLKLTDGIKRLIARN